MNFSVFLGDEYLGDGQMLHPTSYHYFCRTCGTIWCRVICPDAPVHVCLTGNCPTCDDEPWSTPIICDTPRFQQITWPAEALLRDFLFLMAKREPVIHHNPPRVSHDQHEAA